MADYSRLKREHYKMPDYVAKALKSAGVWDLYFSRPAYQQNDYVGWITRAKREETRQKRITQMVDELKLGNVYMNMKWGRKEVNIMGKYVDGFVLVVPDDKTEEYKKMAEEGRDLWMRLGALEYYECRGDDMEPQDMGGEKARAFPEMTGAKSDETVWFSFVVFKSKEHRDEVNTKMIEEMSKQMEGKEDMPIPFDMKRMAYGGFRVEVEG